MLKKGCFESIWTLGWAKHSRCIQKQTGEDGTWHGKNIWKTNMSELRRKELCFDWREVKVCYLYLLLYTPGRMVDRGKAVPFLCCKNRAKLDWSLIFLTLYLLQIITLKKAKQYYFVSFTCFKDSVIPNGILRKGPTGCRDKNNFLVVDNRHCYSNIATFTKL